MSDRTDYSGAIALITGGASGIGRALGQACAERGSEVVLADRQVEAAQTVAEQIRQRGGKAQAVALDVRDPDAFEATVADVLARHGRIDLFFNNVGIGVAGEASDYERADWDDLLDVNVRGVVYGVQAVYPKMVAQGGGHIVNTASMAGFIPMPGGAAYCLSKHGVVGMSKSLRIEGAVHGVRVSALCPGVIRTPILTGGEYGRTEKAGLDEPTIMELWEKLRPMEPRTFARQVLDDVAANEPYIVVPRWWKAVWLFERLAPRLSLRLSQRVYARTRERRATAEPDTDRSAETTAAARTPRSETP